MMFQGKAYWAKIVGKPVAGYKNQYNEWSFDVAITPEVEADLLKLGFPGDKIKNKGDDRGNFVTFKRREIKANGELAKPFKVVDNKGALWDGVTKIGNGSTVNVKWVLNEQSDGSVRPAALAVQVWEFLPYEPAEGSDGFPVADGTAEDWSTTDE